MAILATLKNAYASVSTIADNQWHYTCVDLHQALLINWNTNAAIYPSYRLTLNRSNNNNNEHTNKIIFCYYKE